MSAVLLGPRHEHAEAWLVGDRFVHTPRACGARFVRETTIARYCGMNSITRCGNVAPSTQIAPFSATMNSPRSDHPVERCRARADHRSRRCIHVAAIASGTNEATRRHPQSGNRIENLCRLLRAIDAMGLAADEREHLHELGHRVFESAQLRLIDLGSGDDIDRPSGQAIEIARLLVVVAFIVSRSSLRCISVSFVCQLLAEWEAITTAIAPVPIAKTLVRRFGQLTRDRPLVQAVVRQPVRQPTAARSAQAAGQCKQSAGDRTTTMPLSC